mmetsp:Transcript_11358/g.17290  ORF Transcript_11358/g.17290 Transcript_11358/m.17290 type:complete len:103 (+) Transcript_11358:245-553(+)
MWKLLLHCHSLMVYKPIVAVSLICFIYAIIDARVEEESRKALYHRPSTLVARDRNRQTYTSSIGEGLFSHLRKANSNGDAIAAFEGDEWLTGEKRKDLDRVS